MPGDSTSNVGQPRTPTGEVPGPAVQVGRAGPVATLTLDSGPVNALDVGLLEALVGALADVGRSGARAVLLSGAGRVFCAGVDLRQVLDGGAPYTARLVPALGEAIGALFASPLPVVAAVNGHAIAGGCVLACAADYRVMGVGGGLIGASELAVGVPFPLAALEVLHHALGHRAEAAILSGTLYRPEEALGMGLVHEVVEPDAVRGRALEVAGRLAAMAPDPYRLAKERLRGGALERIRSDGPGLDGRVASIWGTEQTAATLERYLAEHVGRARRPDPVEIDRRRR